MTNEDAANSWPPQLINGDPVFTMEGTYSDMDLVEPSLLPSLPNPTGGDFDITYTFLPQNNSPQQDFWLSNSSLPSAQFNVQLPAHPLPLLPDAGFIMEPPPDLPVGPVRTERRALPSSEPPPLKRLKKSLNAFPCDFEGCEQCFDRAGDMRKHYNRTHLPEHMRPKQCPKCSKRFCYQKDVARHDRQMHQPRASNAAARPASLPPGPQSGPSINPQMLFPSNAPPCEHFADMISKFMSTRRFVLQLKIRRARRQSLTGYDHRRFLMITSDGRDFRAVDVSAATNARQLNNIICKELPIARGLALTQYMLGSGTIGNSLSAERLLYQIFQRPAGHGPMQLFLGSHHIEELPEHED